MTLPVEWEYMLEKDAQRRFTRGSNKTVDAAKMKAKGTTASGTQYGRNDELEAAANALLNAAKNSGK